MTARQTVIPGTTAAEHAELVEQYDVATNAECGGLMKRCMVLALIRRKKTYTAVAPTFEDFVQRELGLKQAYGNLLASAGPACNQLLERAKKNHPTIVGFRIEWFKPIAGMKNGKSQARCLEMSHKVASTRGEQMTAKVVAEVAKNEFDWVSPAEWREKNRKAKKPSHDEVMAKIKELIDSALYLLANCEITADEGVEEFGDPARWPHYLEAQKFMADLYENVGKSV